MEASKRRGTRDEGRGENGKPRRSRRREEADLFRKLRRYKQPARRKRLRDELICRYLPIVRAIARKEWSRIAADGNRAENNMLDEEDLVSAGLFGLMDAIDRFDPERGFYFSTFAGHRIRGAIVDDLRAADHVSRWWRQKEKRGEHVAAGRISLDIDAYRVADVPVALRELLPDYRAVPIDERTAETDFWKEVCRGLSIKERLLLLLYYRERLPMAEVGRHLKLSESRISLIHSDLMRRLAERNGHIGPDCQLTPVN